MKSANELQTEINRLKGIYYSKPANERPDEIPKKIRDIENKILDIMNDITDKNTPVLISEVLNLLSGSGSGFVPYGELAPARYYSDIPGVKNIRINSDQVQVKILSQAGRLLPVSIDIGTRKFDITFIESSNFSGGMDY